MIDCPQQVIEDKANDYQLLIPECENVEIVKEYNDNNLLYAYESSIQIENQYYYLSRSKTEDIISSMIEYFQSCCTKDLLYSSRLNRLLEMLDTDMLDEANIVPKYESFLGFLAFLQNFTSIDKINFAIWLNNDGEFVVETEYTDTYFKARFIDQSSAFYNVFNNSMVIDILKKESLYELYEDLNKYYVL